LPKKKVNLLNSENISCFGVDLNENDCWKLYSKDVYSKLKSFDLLDPKKHNELKEFRNEILKQYFLKTKKTVLLVRFLDYI